MSYTIYLIKRKCNLISIITVLFCLLEGRVGLPPNIVVRDYTDILSARYVQANDSSEISLTIDEMDGNIDNQSHDTLRDQYKEKARQSSSKVKAPKSHVIALSFILCNVYTSCRYCANYAL